jgi:hypothetical protein
MITPRLTPCTKAAKVAVMQGTNSLWRRGFVMSSMLGAVALGGCVSVKAPDKPIVIELNINIRQEVVYRLAEDAKNTIKSNPEIF